MCYPAPGPRCSPHARQELKRRIEEQTGTFAALETSRQGYESAWRKLTAANGGSSDSELEARDELSVAGRNFEHAAGLDDKAQRALMSAREAYMETPEGQEGFAKQANDDRLDPLQRRIASRELQAGQRRRAAKMHAYRQATGSAVTDDMEDFGDASAPGVVTGVPSHLKTPIALHQERVAEAKKAQEDAAARFGEADSNLRDAQAAWGVADLRSATGEGMEKALNQKKANDLRGDMHVLRERRAQAQQALLDAANETSRAQANAPESVSPATVARRFAASSQASQGVQGVKVLYSGSVEEYRGQECEVMQIDSDRGEGRYTLVTPDGKYLTKVRGQSLAFPS